MKLIVFGKDPQQASIVLNSQYVSAYHAELILLDNGDMYLTDKSTNGTYINGARMTPGKEVSVRRGDNIAFADVPINWNQIEEVRVPKNIKRIISIGTNPLNQIVLDGKHISRFHATIREMQDGKWYICDHSTNGTKINGEKLVKDHYTPLKAGDEIVCAGVPIHNPIPNKPVAMYLGISLGAVAAAAMLIWGVVVFINNFNKWNHHGKWEATKVVAMYKPTTMLILAGYHFEVTAGTLDLSNVPDPDSKKRGRYTRSLPTSFYVVNTPSGSHAMAYDGSDCTEYSGTGFFVGDDGYFITNRHIARPWESAKNSQSTTHEQLWIEWAEDYFRSKLNTLVQEGYIDAIQYINQVKVKGVLDYVKIIPDGQFLDVHNAINATTIKVSDNEDIDLALMRVRSKLADKYEYIPYDQIKAATPQIGNKMYTIGFPFGLGLQKDLKNTEISANFSEGSITRTEDQVSFGFSAQAGGGASGSPVIDEYGRLIGVLYEGLSSKESFNRAIRVDYVEQLLRNAKVIK